MRALALALLAVPCAAQEHWAFQPVRDPAPPVAERHGIDHFALARLAREGLAPSPDADRATLVRRLSLDLTGLPPTPTEVHDFVADESSDAYERLVDRLLASPRFGEHFARQWLDAARYADTHGLHFDNYREIWPYRDWVIRSLNDDVPFDRFVVAQLAGDLLPDATLDDRVATGFLRAHVTTNEGGSILDEVRFRNVADRVDTTGTALLGLSIGCAQCHDHKFDPLTQRDYYSLYAFFDELDAHPMDGNAKAHPPVAQVPTAAQSAERDAITAERERLDAEAASVLAEAVSEYSEPAVDALPPPITHIWIDDALPRGARLQSSPFAWVSDPVRSGRLAMRRSGDGIHQHHFPIADEALKIGTGDYLLASVWIDPSDPPTEIMLQWNSDGARDWEHRAFWGRDHIAWGQLATPSRLRLGALPPAGTWVDLRVPARAVGLAPGSVVHGIAFTQAGGTAVWDAIGIETRAPQEPEDRLWLDDAPPDLATLHGDGTTWTWIEAPEHLVFSGRRALRRTGRDGLHQDYFADAPPLRLHAGDRLFTHVFLEPEDPPRAIQLQFHARNWSHRVRWGEDAHGRGDSGGADHRAGDLPPTGRWVRLEVDLAAVDLKPGDALTGVAFTQVGGTVHWDAMGVRTWHGPDARTGTSLDAWTLAAARDEQLPGPVNAAARTTPTSRSDDQRRVLREHFVRHVWVAKRSMFAPFDRWLAELESRQNALENRIPTTLTMRDRAEPRAAFIMLRGQYDQPGDPVQPDTPACLPGMDPALPRTRLGLARWLVDPTNPLTARVTVNRIWQSLFGTGLVKTAEDFGTQGSPPTHPELLDWLASRFIADGWSRKALIRRIVLSRTYRQSSNASAEVWRRDPENLLLARGSRHRLDAEVLRDQALALSGRLVERVGGPPVKPPQPAGLWRAVAYVGSNTMDFVADTDPDEVHRRSIYTFWKRTAPAPQFTTFDAPSREHCVMRRERTNTPLQALLLMNDPQYVDCARGFAERVLRECDADDATRSRYAFVAATCREPTDGEIAELVALLGEQRARFRSEPEDARALLEIGETSDPIELAAWTVVTNLLLNLDEVVTRS